MTEAVFNLDFDILFITILLLSFCLHKNILKLLISFRNITFSNPPTVSDVTSSVTTVISESEIEETV